MSDAPSPPPPRASALVIKGARTHNLKGVDLTLPHRRLIVMTGVSGSGKSSLAFDTIYAEGQRRYVESLSAYARQFLERMEKPDVDSIDGIAPAIAIRQKTTSRNPRSTVGTTTEIHDYLRLLWARVGRTVCRTCDRVVERESPETVATNVLALPAGTRVLVAFETPVAVSATISGVGARPGDRGQPRPIGTPAETPGADDVLPLDVAEPGAALGRSSAGRARQPSASRIRPRVHGRTSHHARRG